VNESHPLLSGKLHVRLTDPFGRVVDERWINNLITNSGREFLAKLFVGQARISKLLIAVGDDGTARSAQAAKTLSQLAEAQAQVTAPKIDETEGCARLRVTATLPATGSPDTQALQEAGIVLVDDAGGRCLYNRVTFPVIHRAGNLDMTLSWEVSF
jgi:hypothetical protein